MTFYDITPVPAPRQTRSDRWKERDCVMRYRAFKDHVRALGVFIPQPCKIVFHMPIPKSYSNKKKLSIIGKPHTQKPDLDNLLKALMDAVFEDDGHIWAVCEEKRWADRPGIEILEKGDVMAGLGLNIDDFQALQEFREKFPSWWYKIGVCDVSFDFDCAPQARSPEIKFIETMQWSDECFSCDSPESLKDAIYSVMGEIEKAIKGESRD